MSKNKYKAKTTIVDGIKFDSKDESLYYLYLKDLKEKGKIKDFGLQQKFVVQDAFIKYGKKQRQITYTPDFAIYHNNGEVEYIDVKSIGSATQPSELRRKMWDFRYRDKKLIWVCRNLKHATIDGQWITYEDLKKIYSNKKKK